VVPVDRDRGCLLLGDHRNAGLWLPPGGHVEVDEHPATTAAREAVEELRIAPGDRLADRPVFVSVTRTVGIDAGHTDVSLWFVLHAHRDEPVDIDLAEFRSARWWSVEQIQGAPSAILDPALHRFVAKLAAAPGDQERPTNV
jgi:8-oxo-dGTP diphosphatase